MSKEVKTYVVTGNNFPVWLNDATRSGYVRVIFDEGEFSHIVVDSPNGKKMAYYGDVIVKTHSGISVLTGEQAQKYKVIPKRIKKQEEKKDENE